MGEGLKFLPGDVVRIFFYGVWHMGIVVNDGYIVSRSFSMGGIVKQTYDEFRRGQGVQYFGYPGSLSRQEVVRRVESRVGENGYCPLTDNCDHLYHFAHGLLERSPQAKPVMLIAGLAGAFCLGVYMVKTKPRLAMT